VTDPKKSSPFASLASLKEALPEGPAAPAAAAASVADRAPRAPEPFAKKIVVAKSKKGRGGKTVTAITGLGGDLEAHAKELRHALGCGATVEDGAVLLQGEQQARARAWLESRGARRVVIGS
jgi:translation initiation factor 1